MNIFFSVVMCLESNWCIKKTCLKCVNFKKSIVYLIYQMLCVIRNWIWFLEYGRIIWRGSLYRFVDLVIWTLLVMYYELEILMKSCYVIQVEFSRSHNIWYFKIGGKTWRGPSLFKLEALWFKLKQNQLNHTF